MCVLNVDDGSLLNDEAPSHVASLLMQISRFRSGHVLYYKGNIFRHSDSLPDFVSTSHYHFNFENVCIIFGFTTKQTNNYSIKRAKTKYYSHNSSESNCSSIKQSSLYQ